MKYLLSLLPLVFLLGCAPTNRPFLRSLSPGDRQFLRSLKGPVVGVNHLWSGDPANEKKRIALAKDMGIQIAREPGVSLAAIENDLSVPKHVSNLLKQAGIERIVLVLHDDPVRVSLERWGRAFKKLAREIDAKYYQIFNEPNNISTLSPEGYAFIFKTAVDSIKPIRPQSKILFGGLGHKNNPFDWLAKFRQTYKGDFVLTLHPYDEGYRFIQRALDIVPSVEVWITEDGSTNSLMKPGLIYGSYVEYLRRYPRIKTIVWYAFLNRGHIPFNIVDDVSGDLRLNNAGAALRDVAVEVRR